MLGLSKPNSASDLDINIKDPQESPADTVSSISWAPSGNNPTFATSDWASYIRIYNLDPESSTLKQQACFDAQSPCLSVKWHENETEVFAGCTDGSIKLYDVASGHCSLIGKHEGPVKSVHWLSSSNALLTLSFDKTLRFWDPRQAEHVAGFKLDYKPFCSDVLFPYLAMGLSEGKCLFVDLHNIQAALGGQIRYADSPLRGVTQLTSLKLFCDAAAGGRFGFGIGGNDARYLVAHFREGDQTLESFNTIIAFKAQIKEKENSSSSTLYPVNSFGFHPHRGYQFIYTCGGEGKMYFWDCKKKSRIAEFDFKDIAATQAEIDPTGKYMAYSIGYDWARGIQGYMSQPSKVCVHVIQDKELEYRYQGNEEYPIKY